MALAPKNHHPAKIFTKNPTGGARFPRRSRGKAQRTRDETAGALMAPPATPLNFFPGGTIRLDPSIPVSVGPNPLSPAHRIIANALISRNHIPNSFSSPSVTQDTAAHIVEKAFEAEIATILNALDGETLPLAVSIYISDEGSSVDIIITANAMGVITPPWFSSEDIDNSIKSSIYAIISKTLSKILPFGSLSDLLDSYSEYNWGGATNDEDARDYLTEMMDPDPEGDLGTLPSDFEALTPIWTTPSDIPPPLHIVTAIQAVEDAATDFANRQPVTDAWNFNFDDVVAIDPSYEDSVSIPSIWLIPDDQTLFNCLDQITQHGMETMFYDVCGAARLSTPKEVLQWLDDFTAGIKFIAALSSLLNIDPKVI